MGLSRHLDFVVFINGRLEQLGARITTAGLYWDTDAQSRPLFSTSYDT